MITAREGFFKVASVLETESGTAISEEGPVCTGDWEWIKEFIQNIYIKHLIDENAELFLNHFSKFFVNNKVDVFDPDYFHSSTYHYLIGLYFFFSFQV
jgi:hypothetical protein